MALGVMDPNNPFRVAMRNISTTSSTGYKPPAPRPVVRPPGSQDGKPTPRPTDPPQPGGGGIPAPQPQPGPAPGAWTPDLQARADRLRQWATDPRRLATVGRRADGSIAYDPAMYGSNYRGTNLGLGAPRAGEPQWGNAGFVPYQWVDGRWVQPTPYSAVPAASGTLPQGGYVGG